MTTRPTINIPEPEFVVVEVDLNISAYEEEDFIHMYISPDDDEDAGYNDDELDYWEYLHDYDY